MTSSDALKFKLWDPASAVQGLIERWVPAAGCVAERDFESSLYDFLHAELSDVQVTKKWQHGRVEADIVVADKVVIELKTDLRSMAEYQRLVGQLHSYKERGMAVFVVLTGQTDVNIRKELDRTVSNLIGIKLFLLQPMHAGCRIMQK